jgi:Fe-S cluster biogenesis protein NfuA
MTDTKIDSPTEQASADLDESQALWDQVEAALDTIRPAIAMDGGNVELLDIEDGVVTLRMMGACGGCPMSTMTLKQGIEQRLRETVRGITRVRRRHLTALPKNSKIPNLAPGPDRQRLYSPDLQ